MLTPLSFVREVYDEVVEDVLDMPHLKIVISSRVKNHYYYCFIEVITLCTLDMENINSIPKLIDEYCQRKFDFMPDAYAPLPTQQGSYKFVRLSFHAPLDMFEHYKNFLKLQNKHSSIHDQIEFI